MEEFIRDHGETCLKLFECPAGVDPLYFSTLCVYFYAERQKGHRPSKRKSQKGCQRKLNGGGGQPAGQPPI